MIPLLGSGHQNISAMYIYQVYLKGELAESAVLVGTYTTFNYARRAVNNYCDSGAIGPKDIVTLKQKKAINGLFCDFRSARGEFFECNGHKSMYFNL